MGLHITNGNTGVTCNTFGWTTMLSLAECFGWEPSGTEQHPEFQHAPEEHNKYDYTSSNMQMITEKDAKAFADALERALVEIPNSEYVSKADRESSSLFVRGLFPESRQVAVEVIETLRGGRCMIF